MVLLTFTMNMQSATWLSGDYDPMGSGDGRTSRCSQELQRAGCLVIFKESSHEGPGARVPLVNKEEVAEKAPRLFKQKIKPGNAGKSVSQKKPLYVSRTRERAPSRSSVGSRPSSSCSLDARDVTSPVTFATIGSCK